MKSVTEHTFPDAVEFQKRPVIVDFWADWCEPCKQMAPRLEELSEAFPEVEFVQVNVDENRSLAQSYGVRGIPTLLFFEEGEPVERVTGAVPVQELAEVIEDTFSVSTSRS